MVVSEQILVHKATYLGYELSSNCANLLTKANSAQLELEMGLSLAIKPKLAMGRWGLRKKKPTQSHNT